MSSATEIGMGHQTRRAWSDWLLIFLFAALLGLPTADYFFGIDHSPVPGENRLPAPVPQFTNRTIAGAQQYVAASETYFNDHFGYRKRLVRWFQQWKLRLYHDQSGTKVVVGRDHWLYIGEQQMVDHYLGLAKFTPAELQTWQKLLEKRRDWLRQRGIQYLLVIPPDKQSVYPEFLPTWLTDAVPKNRETKLDQFLNFMHAHSTVEILDLRPVLVAAKKTMPVYLQNDTHWNLYGGFITAQEVLKTLARDISAVPPLNPADFQWTNVPATGGDLAKMIGTEAAEKNRFAFQAGPNLPVLSTNENDHFKSNWGVKMVFTTENPEPLRHNLVVFRDSFGEAWQSFLGYSFKRAVFELNDQEFSTELISSNTPAVVINEMLERYFDTTDPAEMLKMDALP